MQIYITNGWALFCIFFGAMLLTTFVMWRLSKNFYSMDVVMRRFSIVDLQWPASAVELQNLIQGVYKLPEDKKDKTLTSLRQHLWVDFLFMPAAYGSIFLLCMNLSWKMLNFGAMFFAVFAWLQILPLVLDVIENIYLLKKINPRINKPKDATYKAMQVLELAKWGVPLLATICALSAALYFWLVGRYQISSLLYVGIIVGEVVLFFVIRKIAAFVLKKLK